MELNGLEADEPSVKTHMTATKKEQKAKKSTGKQNENPKSQTPKSVPNKTLKNGQCRYCKETGHMMADWPKPGCREIAKTVTHSVMKKKTATSAPTWETAHRSRNLQTPKRKSLKLTNKLENPSDQK